MSSLLPSSPLRPTDVQLRDYQIKAIDAVRGEFARGKRSTLIVCATGVGKSVILGMIARRVADRGGRTLILAHRGELIEQLTETLTRLGMDPGIEKAGSYARALSEPHAVIATVQTMQRERLLSWPRDYFKLLITDECVTGDTLIVTDKGEIPISSASTIDCSRVLTYNGSSVLWREITAFMPKGERPVLEITLDSGRSIRCTANHPIYTARGWVRAGQIREGHRILCYAAADVASCSGGTSGDDNGGSSPGINAGTESDPGRNGVASTENWWRMPLRAAADAASESGPGPRISTHSSRGATGVTSGTVSATTSGPRTGHYPSRPQNVVPSLAPYSGIPVSSFRIPGASTPASLRITARSNAGGSSTRHHSSSASPRASANSRTKDTVPGPSARLPDVCPASVQSWTWSPEAGRSMSPANGSTPSEISGSRGGSAMTAAPAETGLSSILTDIPVPRWNSPQHGSAIPTGPLPSITSALMPYSTSHPTLGDASSRSSNHISPTACSTSFERVASVRNAGIEPVYDITVDDTHCFFANGMLVHNCHHACASSYREIYAHFNCLHLGVTATPDRADEDSLGDVFESVAYEYSMWDAMTAEPPGPYLSRLRFVQCDVGIDLRQIRTTGSGDLNVEELAEAIRPYVEALANAIRQEIGGRKTLVFTPDVGSAMAMASALDSIGVSARWVSGDCPDRKAIIDGFRKGDFQAMANCAIATEGFDCPDIAAVALCRPTKSRALYAQMAGRGTRLAPGKENCLLVDFNWLTEKHQLVKAVELFDTTHTDSETLDIATEMLIEQKGLDLKDVIEEAAEEKRRRTVLRIQARERQIRYRRVSYDPLAAMDTLGVTIRQEASSLQGTITRSQKERLERFGLTGLESCSKRRASALLDVLSERRQKGLATHKQVAHLIKNNVEPETARAMTKAQASEFLGKLWGDDKRDGKVSGDDEVTTWVA